MVVDRWRSLGTWFTVLALTTWVGCNSSDSSSSPSESNATAAAVHDNAGSDIHPSAPVTIERHASPDVTVTEFLTALKSGDQPRATSMLTVMAQQEMAKSQAMIQPPGSPTAQFRVTKSEILGDQQDGAHVLSTWTDTEEDGSVSTHDIVWILRRETAGWAIAGFATRVFEDQPPLILNFEDPLDLQRKREAVDSEIARRSEPQTVRQAQFQDTELRR